MTIKAKCAECGADVDTAPIIRAALSEAGRYAADHRRHPGRKKRIYTVGKVAGTIEYWADYVGISVAGLRYRIRKLGSMEAAVQVWYMERKQP